MTDPDLGTGIIKWIPILSVLLNNYATAAYRKPFSGDWTDLADGLGANADRTEVPKEIGPTIERGTEMTKEGILSLVEFITAAENELSVS